MKVGELRIGNLLQLDPDKDWFPLKDDLTIKVNSISNQGINYSCYPELGVIWEEIKGTFKPIPLTEEWLLKFGFTKRKEQLLELVATDYQLELNCGGGNSCYLSFMITHKGDTKSYGSYTTNGYWSAKNYFSVHQLQNLYFALAGEELTITEKGS